MDRRFSIDVSPLKVRRCGSIAALALAYGLSPTVAQAATLDLDHFVLTFEERFATLDISAGGPGTRWIAHTPWHGDFGDAVFADPGPDGPFSLTPAGLRITARQDAQGRWRSGLISSMDRDGVGQRGFAQQFGYFEMRAKLPDGAGVWPAFWLIGIDKTKDASEIDVIEYYGAFPGYYHSWMHLFQDGKDLLLHDHLTHVPSSQMTSNFNDYGVLITPQDTRFFFNRQEIWSMPTPPQYRQPMYVLVDLALGGGWPIDKLKPPAVMDVADILVFRDGRLPQAAGQ